MVKLRSGLQTRYGNYDLDYCRCFLSGNYPNCSLFTLEQLKQLMYSLEENYGTVHFEFNETRENIALFLISQWRLYHENKLRCSTPPNRRSYKTTYDRMLEYCKVQDWQTDSDEDLIFDEEFFCNICMQDDCVKNGFLGPGFSVHSPSYGNNCLKFRTDKTAHKKSLEAKKLYIEKKKNYRDKKYGHMLLDNC
jgi:hypothetical protein